MTVERKRIIKGFIVGYLFEAGLITLDQLDVAMERQLELIVQGRTLSLGEVLVETGVITREQFDRIKTRQWTNETELGSVPKGGSGQEGVDV
jgi:hypothetical protein